MQKTKSGFTIVELLIVIVVIAILAAISVVSYTGIQARALNTARIQEAQEWHKLLQVYLGYEGNLPQVTAQSYCLGTGFPNGDGIAGGECRDYTSATNVYHENDNTALMNELKRFASLPSGPRTPINGTVGPYINIWSTGYYITLILQGNNDTVCPSNTEFIWTDGTQRVMCGLTFEF